MFSLSRVTGGAFLIAGTCVGAGMLALPVVMSGAGFYYALLLLTGCWLFMFYTGLLVLETNINLPAGANFVSMAKSTLGNSAAGFTWLIYLLLLFALMSAYLSGVGDLVVASARQLLHMQLQPWLAALPMLVLMAIFICLGARFVDFLGRFLLVGLIAAYALLVAIAWPHLHAAQLTFGQVKYIFPALTVIAAAFGFHVIIPSLRVYLRDDVVKLKKTIFFGSLIPLVVYICWIVIVFGIIPIGGAHGLLAILHAGNPVSLLTNYLTSVSGNTLVPIVTRFFILFAIASSFLGIAFSLFDFLADGLQIKKNVSGKLGLLLIAFLPPYLFVLFYPHGFILALSYAGIFVAILHGILPALMVWRRRMGEAISSIYTAPGSKIALLIVLALSVLIIISQFLLALGVWH